MTDKGAYWTKQGAIDKVPYREIKSIEFIGKKRKGKMMDSTDDNKPTMLKKSLRATDEEEQKFYASLSKLSGVKPVILSVLPNYSDSYVPLSVTLDLPPSLSTLYDTKNLSLSYFELLKLAHSTEINITEEQIALVQSSTVEQNHSKIWFRMRTGRVTASKFKAVCHTDPAMPSLSLIVSICHPESFRFSTLATKWGCNHEKAALDEYSSICSSKHRKFYTSSAGLFVSKDHPFLHGGIS